MQQTIAVIVPVLNEQVLAAAFVDSLLSIPEITEVLLCDGGSVDGTAELTRADPRFRLLRAGRGRGRQMNVGAAVAASDVLWFLHADSTVPAGGAAAILLALRDPVVAGGAFRFSLDASGPTFRLIEIGVHLRCMVFKAAYGDQGYFVRREVFAGAGGYPETAVMEDVYFWRRLKKSGRVAILNLPLRTSARRWQANGAIRTTAIHWLLIAGDWIGVSNDALARFRSRMLSGGRRAETKGLNGGRG